MKKFIAIVSTILLPLMAFPQAVPPSSVVLKDALGNKVTTSTSGSHIGLDVNIIAASGDSTSTVNQGSAGSSPWLASITNFPSSFSISNFPSTQAVTGTFFQSVQPVSGTLTCNAGSGTLSVDASGHTVPVSGSFYQSVQPVSFASTPTVNANILNASIPVTGTFFQSVQPVSGSLGRTWTLNSSTDSVAITGGITVTNPSIGTNAVTAPTSSTQVAGVNPSGNLTPLSLSASKNLLVDGSSVTQPISASSLPLPSGASTSAAQASLLTELMAINNTLGSPFQELGLIGNTSFGATQSGTWTVGINNFPSGFGRTWNLGYSTDSVTSYQGGAWNVGITGTLPAFASTPTVNAAQSGSWTTGRTWTLNSSTDSVAVTGSITASNPSIGTNGVAGPLSSTQVAGVNPTGNLKALTLDSSNYLLIDGSNVTQPVSGSLGRTWALNASGDSTTAYEGGTWNVNVSSSALPTGAATQAGLTTINTTLGSPFQAGGSIGNTSFGSSQVGTWTTGRTWTLGASNDSTTAYEGGTWNLNNITGVISLPTGAATQSGLTTINTTLGSPFQAGGSIGNTSFGASQVGTWTTGRTWNTSASSDSTLAYEGGTWNLNNITGTISLPTGAATQAGLTTINTTLGSPFQAGGSIANTSFGASQVGTWTTGRTWTLGASNDSTTAYEGGTWNVNVSSSALPSGAATSALQSAGNASLATIAAGTPSLGQTTMSGSVPVAIASNQSAIPVTQSGTWTTGRTWTLNASSDSTTSYQGGSWTTAVNGLSSGGNTLAIGSSGNILVSGAAPVGSAPVLNPVPVSGVDGAGNKQNFTMTTGTNALKVDGSGVTQPVSGTVSVATLPQDTFPASGSITTVDTGTTSTTYLNNQVWITGTPTTGSFVTFATTSIATGQVEISGTWTGTIQLEVSVDNGTTYTPHAIYQLGSPNFIGTFTNNVIGSINLAGKTNMRLRATSAMTGTAVVKVTESVNDSSFYVANSLKIVDGSTTVSAPVLNIAPASTAATSTQTAVVVAMSPNTTGNVAVTSDKEPVNANSLLSPTQSVTTTESTLVAPSNTVAVVLESDSINTGNVRWGFSNSTASILSSTKGMLMEPGRDSPYLRIGAGNYLHLISVSGTNNVNVQWILSQ